MEEQGSIGPLLTLYSSRSSSTSSTLSNGTKILEATFKPNDKNSNEDRTVFLQSPSGLLVAIFDGHHSDELSEYASKTLLTLLSERIETSLARENHDVHEAISSALIEGLRDFDKSLLDDLIAMFPEKEATDWSAPKWADSEDAFFALLGIRGEPKFQKARLAVVGTTALVAFIDKERENIWVASLGDSDAVLGRVDPDSGAVQYAKRLNDHHNGGNEAEVKRLNDEHPNEPPIVRNKYVLGALAVTRALGNHQLKTPYTFSQNILRRFYPTPFVDYAKWFAKGHQYPPYISATASVKHSPVKRGDTLVMASDGLVRHFPFSEEEDTLALLVALVADSPSDSLVKFCSEKLGHKLVERSQVRNVAESLIQDTCFGGDLKKMERVVNENNWDDISVVVVRL